jgi:hypothetical protein
MFFSQKESIVDFCEFERIVDSRSTGDRGDDGLVDLSKVEAAVRSGANTVLFMSSGNKLIVDLHIFDVRQLLEDHRRGGKFKVANDPSH